MPEPMKRAWNGTAPLQPETQKRQPPVAPGFLKDHIKSTHFLLISMGFHVGKSYIPYGLISD